MTSKIVFPHPVSKSAPATPAGARAFPVWALLMSLALTALGLFVTVFMWQASNAELARNGRAEFDFQVRQTAYRIRERMGMYEQVQRGTQAFLLGSMKVPRADFMQYVDDLRLAERYPGIQGIALVELVPAAALPGHIERVRREQSSADYQIRPAGQRAMYSSITMIHPFSGLNVRAFGYDMLTEPHRRAAMERARDTGGAAASARVRLVQEDGRDEQAGIVMYIPVYARGAPVDSLERRRSALVGWVGAPFRMNDLMEGLRGERAADISLAIYDGADTVQANELYRSSAAAADGQPAFQAVEHLQIAGRNWTLVMASAPAFEKRLQSSRPLLIAVTGIAASVLLGLLVWMLASGRRHALQLAARATEHLRASEFRWKYALEGAGDGVWDLDLASGKVVYSRRWKEMLGYRDEDISNDMAAWEALIHPDDAPAVRGALDAYLASKDANYTVQFRMRRKDGHWSWILARGMAVTRDGNGFPVRTIGTHTDITQTKADEAALRQANAALAAQQQRYQVMLAHSHDAFVAVAPSGRVTDWSVKAEKLLGWPPEQAIGADLAELIIPEPLRAAHNAGFRRFVKDGKGQTARSVIEVEAVHRDGHLVPIELAIAGFPDLDGYAVTAFIRDISQRKAAQRLEAQRSRELEEAQVALQHAQRLEAVGKLTGGVAHDFNNVLHVLGGNLQLLKRTLGPDERLQQRIQSMQNAVDRGAKLSSQLLSFARKQPLQPTVVNLQKVLAGMDGLLKPALSDALELQVVVQPGLWNIQVDVNQLENVILNLVINARDAMAGSGVVVIELDNYAAVEGQLTGPGPGQYVRFAVRDTGCGMDEQVKAMAFEPFFTTKPVGAGTGLGLSMTYGFVKQSGGSIELDSAIGKGTSVLMYFPRSALDEDVIGSAEQPTAAGGNEIILVVEDEAEVRATAVATLSQLGYRLLEAQDGDAASRVLETADHIDMLFTDVVMPGQVSSTELARRAVEKFPGIAVLFTSGYTRDAIVTEGRLPRGVNLLGKPYYAEQLAQRIRALLSREPKRD